MQTKHLISVNELCVNHNIEISFISSLQRTGLIELITNDESAFIKVDQLPHLEKIILLHDELDINLEGIETITHLLQKISDMQDEIVTLRNRLRLYETNV